MITNRKLLQILENNIKKIHRKDENFVRDIIRGQGYRIFTDC